MRKLKESSRKKEKKQKKPKRVFEKRNNEELNNMELEYKAESRHDPETEEWKELNSLIKEK